MKAAGWFYKTLIALLVGSSTAMATDWSFVPSNALREQLQKGNWSQALQMWDQSAVPQDTPTRKALYDYVIFQSGMKNIALDSLFEIQKPQNMHPKMKKLWSKAVDAKDSALQNALYSWDKSFTGILRSEVSQALFAYHKQSVKDAKELRSLAKDLPDSAEKDSPRDTWTRWLVALWAPVFNQPDLGLDQVQILKDSPQTMIGADQLNLTNGRILYQMGRLPEAIEAYSQVSKGSDFWFEALEERAWAHLRQSQAEKSLADLQTVNSSFFQSITGPEPFVLANLAYLDICDYASIFKSTQQFKERFKTRVAQLKSFSQPGSEANLSTAFGKLETDHSLKTLVTLQLPRQALRDSFLKRLGQYRRTANSELAQLRKWQGEWKIIPGALTSYIQKTEAKLGKAAQFGQKRIAELAGAELKEIKSMTHKLQLVEAEVIQRVTMEERVANRKVERDSFEKGKRETLSFPSKGKEIWLDEVGNYSVRVKDCPGIQKAAL